MAKANVVHSLDAATIIFNGDKGSPEPSTGIIKFPGGCVEVSRCSDGQYWAHISLQEGEITDGRIDYAHGVKGANIVDIPQQELIQKIAIKINKGAPQ